MSKNGAYILYIYIYQPQRNPVQYFLHFVKATAHRSVNVVKEEKKERNTVEIRSHWRIIITVMYNDTKPTYKVKIRSNISMFITAASIIPMDYNGTKWMVNEEAFDVL